MLMRMLSLVSATFLFASVNLAAQETPDAPIDEAAKAEVIADLNRELADRYVFPEKAAEIARELESRLASGSYAGHDTAQSFADALNTDLRAVGDDGHFRFIYRPGFDDSRGPGTGAPTAEQVAQEHLNHQRAAHGIPHIERLAGNIGYLDIRGFYRPEFVGAAYDSAMQLLAGSDAILIDLRSNGGGDPQSVALLMSHFFARGDERHINSIYHRPSDTTREFWTDPTVETRFAGPVYVVTSGYTFSGGEEFAYDMKTHRRGTLVGETTGGGANPGATVKLKHGFAAFIPDGMAVNPITGTNWEHVGVTPDIEASAREALASAYAAALENVLANEQDETRKAELEQLLERARAGEADLPGWSDPRSR
ncbi:MAG: S41 family peptidase [Erythrobacter sp.]